jgi:coproporphyrinogen III oxidase-like Fe-S oxidoreductase
LLVARIKSEFGPLPELSLQMGAQAMGEIAPSKRQLRTAQRRYERKKEAFAEGLISLAELRAEHDKLQALMEEESRLAQFESAHESLQAEVEHRLVEMFATDRLAFIEDGRFFLDETLPVELRRRMLSFFLQSIYVHTTEKIVLTMSACFW